MISSKITAIPMLGRIVAINSLVMFGWWIIFHPGFFSRDSFAIIDMVKEGPITSDWTAIWPFAVKLLTFSGSQPALATLFFSQVFSISFTLFAFELFNKSRSYPDSLMLSLTPLIGAIGITLWHDIPMTSGFFLFVTGINRLKNDSKYPRIFILLGIFLSGFRFNGIATLIIALVVFIIILDDRKRNAALLVALIVFGIFFTALNQHFNAPVRTQSAALIEWMRYDIACYASTSKDRQFLKNSFGNDALKNWSSPEACTWFLRDDVSKLRNSETDSVIPYAWLAMLKKDPRFVFDTHLKRNSYLIPMPIYGLQRIPFIHTTIELSGKGISFSNPVLAESARNFPRAWNLFSNFFGYSGFWLLVIFFFAFLRRNLLYLQIGVIGLVLNVSLFVVAVIPDGRFSLFVLAAGQLILMGEILGKIRKTIDNKSE